MHKNFIWQAFLLLVLFVALAYTGIGCYRYYSYIRLNAHTTAINSEQWHVDELAEDEFILEVAYIFTVNDTKYDGATAWPKERFLNPWAAEKAIPDFSARHKIVWYDASDPHHSTLNKKFPIKECVSAIFLWALFLYFLWLGYYVAKYKTWS